MSSAGNKSLAPVFLLSLSFSLPTSIAFSLTRCVPRLDDLCTDQRGREPASPHVSLPVCPLNPLSSTTFFDSLIYLPSKVAPPPPLHPLHASPTPSPFWAKFSHAALLVRLQSGLSFSLYLSLCPGPLSQWFADSVRAFFCLFPR